MKLKAARRTFSINGQGERNATIFLCDLHLCLDVIFFETIKPAMESALIYFGYNSFGLVSEQLLDPYDHAW